MSLSHVALCSITLVVASVFSVLESPWLRKHAPPVLCQLALTGLLPPSALKMPVYPLTYVNGVLFVTMTTLNVLLMVRSTVLYAAIFLIVAVLIPVVYAYRQMHMADHSMFKELGLDLQPHLLLDDSMSAFYLVHLFAMMVLFFTLVMLAS